MTRRWLLGGLIASLALNLLLLGFVGGRAFAHFLRPAIDPDPAHRFSRLLGFLPDERRAALRPFLRERRRALGPFARELRQLHRELRETLGTEVFDAEALESTLSRLRSRLNEAQRVNHERLVSVSGQMTADERRQLAEWMAKRGWRRHRGHPERHERAPRGDHWPDRAR